MHPTSGTLRVRDLGAFFPSLSARTGWLLIFSASRQSPHLADNSLMQNVRQHSWSKRSTMKSSYWQYFLAIEADLDATVRFVEPDPKNYETYSIEFAKILLSACSEVDVISKVLAKEIKPGSKPDNINQHRSIILHKYSGLPHVPVTIPRFGITLQPWKSWDSGKNPDWWKSYNSVKHKRHLHFGDANQINALQSVAALFSLLVYLYHRELFHDDLHPWPRLLDLAKNPDAIIPEDQYQLPGFDSFSAWRRK